MPEKHLSYMCLKYLSRLPPGSVEDNSTESVKTPSLLSVCPSDPRCLSLLKQFTAGTLDTQLKQALSEFLLMFSKDAPVLTVLPYRYLDIIRQISHGVTSGDRDISMLKWFALELHKVILAVIMVNAAEDICSFVTYFVDFVEQIHSADVQFCPATQTPIHTILKIEWQIVSAHMGIVLGQLPSYTMGMKQNYDESPSDEQKCEKRYTKVFLGGWPHLFLWFCPIHGHCFGFHIISGPEGRKD